MRARLFLLPLALAAGGTGCSYFSNGAYPPVQHALGDSVVVFGADSLHAIRNDRFEVYGPTAASVAAVRDDLDHSTREFRRYFGIYAPLFAVVLFDTPEKSQSFDPTALRNRGLRVVRIARPARSEGRSLRDDNAERWPVSRRAAVVMLGGWASRKRAADSSDAESRLPVWYRQAVTGLTAAPQGYEGRGGFLSRVGSSETIPLVEIFASKSALADSVNQTEMDGPDPSQPRERSRSLLFSSEARSVAQYLAEKEGPEFIGAIGEKLLAGQSMETILQQSRVVPKDIPALEAVWRAWMRTEDRR
ncbi:MAG: hypothetical protein ACR2OG_02410 [Gemmatimonadaceae bacterium]